MDLVKESKLLFYQKSAYAFILLMLFRLIVIIVNTVFLLLYS